MFEAVAKRIIRAVFGGGSDISAANPLPVDISPGAKTATTVLDEATIAAATTTVLGDCTTIDLSDGARALTLTLEVTYNAAATQGVEIHIRTSTDDADWDTEDWDSWTPAFAAGTTIRQTKHYDTAPYAVRVLVENLDPALTITDVAIISVVGP